MPTLGDSYLISRFARQQDLGDRAPRGPGGLPVTRLLRTLAFLLPLLGLAAAAGAQTAPSAFTTGYRYDSARRLTGTIAPDPDGDGPLRFAAVRNSYDIGGRLVRVEKGELSNWQSEAVEPKFWPGFAIYQIAETAYDPMDRKTVEKASVGSPVPTLAQTSYDSAGRVECVALRMNPAAFGSLPASACTLGAQGGYGSDRITRNVYDSAGQLRTVQKAYATPLQQNEAAFEYTDNGKRKSVTDANGNRAELRYDGHDRQSCWIFPSKTVAGALGGDCVSGDFESYGYDPNGNRTQLRKRDGAVIGYEYDALNRVAIKDVPEFGLDVRYTYDLRGLQTGAWFTGSGHGVWTDHDGFGRPLSSTGTMGGVARTLTYEHDADGNRTRVTHPDGMAFGFGHDGLGRMNAVVEPGSVVATFDYDAGGRRRTAGYRGAFTNYGYDSASRLQSMAHDLGGTGSDQTFGFTYNPASQIVTRSGSNDSYAWTGAYAVSRAYQVNGLNQYTSAGTATPRLRSERQPRPPTARRPLSTTARTGWYRRQGRRTRP